MSNLTLDEALRAVVRDVLREELRALQTTSSAAPTSTPPPSRHDEFISTNEAAEIAGVRPATVRAWIRQGHLRCVRAGRLVRVRLDELRAYLARATTEPESETDLDARALEILSRPRSSTTRRKK